MGFRDLLELARATETRLRVGVVFPDFEEIYKALATAADLGFDPILIGREDTVRRMAADTSLGRYELVEAIDSEAAATVAVELAASGKMDLLMKGSVNTAILMKAVLHDKDGIRGGALLSHVAVFESPDGRFIGVTDGGLNINPTVEQKADIIRNAAAVFHRLGVAVPNIALLSGVEILTPAIPSTVDAAELTVMAENGAFPDTIVDGPMAFDLAFNPAACRAKHYAGKIRGNADILVVPEIVSGNILGKALNHAAGYASGGVVVGAKIPIVLLSRSDRAEEKLNSLLIAGALARAGGPM